MNVAGSSENRCVSTVCVHVELLDPRFTEGKTGPVELQQSCRTCVCAFADGVAGPKSLRLLWEYR